MTEEEQAIQELVERAYGDSLSAKSVFTDEKIQSIAKEFRFPPEQVPEIQAVLNGFAFRWHSETKLAQTNFPTVRREFGAIAKAADSLLNLIDKQSEDAKNIYGLASSTHRLAKSIALSFPEERDPAGGRMDAVIASVNAQVPNMEALVVELTALSTLSQSALGLAGSGRTGRPNDDAADDLMRGVYQVWTAMLVRDFALDWAPDGKPITDAARFCVAVWQCVDPSTGLNKIANAASKQQKIGCPIKDLEKLPKILDHYSKHIR